MPTAAEMAEIAGKLKTKSAKIRALDAAGFKRADIARFLEIRYQHVRNVLIQPPPKNERNSATNEHDIAQATPEAVSVKIGEGGRVVIPSEFRKAIGASEGDNLTLQIENDVLVLLPLPAVIRRVQEAVRKFVPEGVSLVDELIAERRREAAAEAGDG